MMEFPEIYSRIPRNSLVLKCLSKLADMMRRPTESNCKDRIQSPSYSKSKNALQLPIDVVQLMVDYMTQEWIPIRADALCALISNGCYSLNLGLLRKFSNFNDEEVQEILAILMKNCDHLSQVNLNGIGFTFHLKDNRLNGLQYLRCTLVSIEDLFTIFLSCPNLVRLELWPERTCMSDQLIASVFEKLQQPDYNQTRHSLRDLKLGGHINVFLSIKLLALFPNLTKFQTALYSQIYNIIINAQDTGYIFEDGNSISASELKKVSNILSQLQGLRVWCEESSVIVTLSPNLQELYLYDWTTSKDFSNQNAIGKLKHLKRLLLAGSSQNASFQLIISIFLQIGYNLEYLVLDGFDTVDVLVIARYCPNLQHLSICDPSELSANRSTLGKLYLPKQERENLKKPFQHLKSLRLTYWKIRDEVTGKLITYILTHANNIERIIFHNCAITERQLAKLKEINRMEKLRFLIIRVAGIYIKIKSTENRRKARELLASKLDILNETVEQLRKDVEEIKIASMRGSPYSLKPLDINHLEAELDAVDAGMSQSQPRLGQHSYRASAKLTEDRFEPINSDPYTSSDETEEFFDFNDRSMKN